MEVSLTIFSYSVLFSNQNDILITITVHVPFCTMAPILLSLDLSNLLVTWGSVASLTHKNILVGEYFQNSIWHFGSGQSLKYQSWIFFILKRDISFCLQLNPHLPVKRYSWLDYTLRTQRSHVEWRRFLQQLNSVGILTWWEKKRTNLK